MTVASLAPGPMPTPPQPAALVPTSAPNSGGMSFGDILDAVNPLEHIPIISGLYRAATGSHISAAAQVTGDTLYGALLPGGVIAGFASSLADVAVKETTGSDISQHVLNTLTSSGTAQTPTATALIPVAQGSAPPISTNPPAIPLLPLSHNAKATNAQYERAQAFDALNSKLVKMAV